MFYHYLFEKYALRNVYAETADLVACHPMVPPLVIVLNGPPAIGKSTIAKRYVDDHPRALNLDIDTIRCMIGGWLDDQAESGRLARSMAIAMAGTHLGQGYDIVIPQLIARPPFLDDLEQVARAGGAQFKEIVLMADRDEVLERLAERDDMTTEPGRFNPQELIAANGGTTGVMALYDRLLAFLGTRPGAVTVPSRPGHIEDTYARVLRALS